MASSLESSIFTAEKFLQYLKSRGQLDDGPVPKNMVVCFIPFVAHGLCSEPHWEKRKFLGATLYTDSNHPDVGVLTEIGVGAPALVAKLEELNVLGVKRVLGLGVAGSLTNDHQVGQVVLANGALRQEGCSQHYGVTELKVFPHKGLVESLAKGFGSPVASELWVSTDAPYRETPSKIEQWMSQGAGCVEMEASALFSVAKFLGLEAASVAVISDFLGQGEWQPYFHHKVVKDSLFGTIHAAVQILRCC